MGTGEEVNVILKPNHTLLDPDFDGYKLNLERLTPITKSLNKPPAKVNITGTSYNETKQLMLFNCLFEDRFTFEKVYYLDTNLNAHELFVVFGEIHNNIVTKMSNSQFSASNYPSISFSSKDLAVIFDGGKQIKFYQTGKRNIPKDETVSQWKLLATFNFDHTISSVLYSVGHFVENNEHLFEFTIVTANNCSNDELQEDSQNVERKTLLTVRKFLINACTENAAEKCRINFEGSTFPETAFLNDDSTLLQVAGLREFKVESKETAKEGPFKITCSQNEKFLKVDISEIKTEESDLQVKIMSNTLKCVDKKKEIDLIEAEFCSQVNAERCNWSLNVEERMLTLMLEKEEIGAVWRQLFMTEEWQNCVYMISDDVASSFDEKGDGDMQNKPYNIEELEGCDDFSATERSKWQLFELNWESYSLETGEQEELMTCKSVPKFTSSLHSHEILFSRVLNFGDMPSLCLRHDVDALLWETTLLNNQSSSITNPWQHTMTFNALGYVQASKRERKFISCAPSGKYAAIAESARRVYLYLQPEAIETTLVNRKTGRRVPKIAKQFVLTLDNVEDSIVGLVCYNEHLYILQLNEVVVYSVI